MVGCNKIEKDKTVKNAASRKTGIIFFTLGVSKNFETKKLTVLPFIKNSKRNKDDLFPKPLGFRIKAYVTQAKTHISTGLLK